uniref:Uncharacterized protein n=1 Tax=Trichuris muris TaxID=70415 RepID=A0A5S6Q7H1_TRIMR
MGTGSEGPPGLRPRPVDCRRRQRLPWSDTIAPWERSFGRWAPRSSANPFSRPNGQGPNHWTQGQEPAGCFRRRVPMALSLSWRSKNQAGANGRAGMARSPRKPFPSFVPNLGRPEVNNLISIGPFRNKTDGQMRSPSWLSLVPWNAAHVAKPTQAGTGAFRRLACTLERLRRAPKPGPLGLKLKWPTAKQYGETLPFSHERFLSLRSQVERGLRDQDTSRLTSAGVQEAKDSVYANLAEHESARRSGSAGVGVTPAGANWRVGCFAQMFNFIVFKVEKLAYHARMGAPLNVVEPPPATGSRFAQPCELCAHCAGKNGQQKKRHSDPTRLLASATRRRRRKRRARVNFWAPNVLQLGDRFDGEKSNAAQQARRGIPIRASRRAPWALPEFYSNLLHPKLERNSRMARLINRNDRGVRARGFQVLRRLERSLGESERPPKAH